MKALSLLCLFGVLGLANTLLLAAPPPAVVLGFAKDSDLFESLPGDKVRLETAERGKAMRWDVNYANKRLRKKACYGKSKNGLRSPRFQGDRGAMVGLLYQSKCNRDSSYVTASGPLGQGRSPAR